MRVDDFLTFRDGAYRIDSSNPLAKALLIDAGPPEGFELLRTVRREGEGKGQLYAKAFAIHQVAKQKE